MKNNKSVYITFPISEAPGGTLNDFLLHLKSTLLRTLDNALTFYVKGIDFSEENYIEFVKKSDLYILFMGTPADEEEQYTEELIYLHEHLKEDTGNITESSKILKICLNPESNFLVRDKLLAAPSYNFYKQNRMHNSHLKFTFENDPIRSWSTLLDLVYDVKSIFETDSEQLKNNKYIYLGSCADNSGCLRNEIKREVQELGYQIFPRTQLPETKMQLRERISELLSHSQYIVQIIGPTYGRIIPGDKVSVYELENNVVSEHLKNHPDIKRIIWIPENLEKMDSKQSLLLSRIRKGEQGNQTEMVECSASEFKSVLANRLLDIGEEGKEESSNDLTYIIAESADDVSDLINTIENLGQNVLNDLKTPHSNYYQSHLENLSNSSYIIIYYVDDNIDWLRSIITILIRAQANQGKRYSGVCVISDSAPDLTNAKKWIPGITHISLNYKEELPNFYKTVTA